MKLVVRSTLCSITIHASILVVLGVASQRSHDAWSSTSPRETLAFQATIAEAVPESVEVNTEAENLQLDPEPIPNEARPANDVSQRQSAQQSDSLALPGSPVSHYPTESRERVKRKFDPLHPDVRSTTRRVKKRIVSARRPSSVALVMPPGRPTSETADLSGNPPPQYPIMAVQKQWEGVVTLRLLVSATGKIRLAEVVTSSGHAILDEAAKDAVMTWQAEPATRLGQPIESEEVLPIRFRL